MPVNSRQKGKRGELEAVKFLKSLGFDARRTQQYSGAEGTSDVTCLDLPDWHIEVKYGVQGLDLGTARWWQALDQAQTDSAAIASLKWCVLWRPKGCKQWRMTCTYHGMTITLAMDEDIKACLSSLGGAITSNSGPAPLQAQ